MTLSRPSPYRNEATSRSIPLENTHISRDRSYPSKSIRGLNLRAKIELPIAYSYTSRRRLYIMRRVFLRYTLCTQRRISSKLVSSARGPWIRNGHTWGVSRYSGVRKEKICPLVARASIRQFDTSGGLLTHDRLVESIAISSTD